MDETRQRMKDYLAGLEDAPLPDDLRVRVAAARRRRLGARLGVAVSCSVAVAAVAMVLVQPDGVLRQETLSPGLALEASTDVSQTATADEREIYRSVQAIDRALQVAYDRQATDEEVAPLWEARHDLMLAAAAVRKNG